MRWLGQIRSQLQHWHCRRETAALQKDIAYHQRAEQFHHEAAWRLRQELYSPWIARRRPKFEFVDIDNRERRAHNILDIVRARRDRNKR